MVVISCEYRTTTTPLPMIMAPTIPVPIRAIRLNVLLFSMGLIYEFFRPQRAVCLIVSAQSQTFDERQDKTGQHDDGPDGRDLGEQWSRCRLGGISPGHTQRAAAVKSHEK